MYKCEKKEKPCVTGRELKKLRMSMKLTRGEFCKRLGVSVASLYNWESGKMGFSKYLKKILKVKESMPSEETDRAMMLAPLPAASNNIEILSAVLDHEADLEARQDRELRVMQTLLDQFSQLPLEAKRFLVHKFQTSVSITP